MPTLQTSAGAFGGVNLSNAQAGNAASTNVADRGAAAAPNPALLKIVTAVGATPTCTYLIEGSADGVNWFPAAYADAGTPATVVATTFVITTAGTAYKVLQADQPWRYLRVTYSANTNVTNTVDVFAF